MSQRSRVGLAVAALALGGGIYAVGRGGLRLHAWLSEIGTLPRVSLTPWVANVLPDALWQFSFCALVFAVWSERRGTWTARCCMAMPVVLGIGSELAQGLGWIEGVFDPADLLAMVVATVLAGVMMLGQRGVDRGARALG